MPFPGTELYESYHKKYGFTNWWLSSNGFNSQYRSEGRIAFYQRIFYDDRGQLPGRRTFFPHDGRAWKAIWEMVKFVGDSYLEVYPRRISANPFLRRILKGALKVLVWLSYFTYSASPPLERAIFGPLLLLGRKLSGMSRG